jgi:hypothetical protein
VSSGPTGKAPELGAHLGVDGTTTLVEVPVEELSFAAADVVRLAGGERARARAMLRDRIAAVTPLLPSSAQPRYAVALHAVDAAADERLTLAGGRSVSFGVRAVGATPPALAALVCTIGAGPDAAGANLSAASGPLDAWVFDAVVLAALESLEMLGWRHVARTAARSGLYVGAPLVPAVGTLPPTLQHELFACVDAAAIGVSLDAAGTMRPLKSFSCWLPLVSEATSGDPRLHLCESCDLDGCRFRQR